MSSTKRKEINTIVFLIDMVYGGVYILMWILSPVIYIFTWIQWLDYKVQRACINSMANREVEIIKKEMNK